MTDPPDFEVGRFAVRTFNLVCERDCDLYDGQNVPLSGFVLTGVYHHGDQWLKGACEARCGKGFAHGAPAKECGCGIYGALSLESLTRQFPTQASRLVAVIAAEGNTIIGPRGLVTQFARVVAYWCSPYADDERYSCHSQFLDAKEFTELAAMLKAYGIPVEAEK